MNSFEWFEKIDKSDAENDWIRQSSSPNEITKLLIGSNDVFRICPKCAELLNSEGEEFDICNFKRMGFVIYKSAIMCGQPL